MAAVDDPCKTDAGSMREDRLVLPIPPDVHWADEMPILLPEAQQVLRPASSGELLAAGWLTAGVLTAGVLTAGALGPRKQKQRYVQFGPPGTAPIQPERAAKKDKLAKKPK